MKNIFGTNGLCLVFQDSDEDLYQDHIKRINEVEDQTYSLLRARHGVYSSNRDIYVDRPEDLNEFDRKIMEKRFADAKKGR